MCGEFQSDDMKEVERRISDDGSYFSFEVLVNDHHETAGCSVMSDSVQAQNDISILLHSSLNTLRSQARVKYCMYRVLTVI